MTDSLGSRAKFAVLIPSTNTSVQPEFDAMAPPGVTNHISRIIIPNIALKSDADFNKLIELIAAAQMQAVDSVMSAEPDRLVLGISAETFWDGLAASRKLKKDLEAHTGLKVSMGAEACDEAFKALKVRKIGVVTPYWPVGDKNVQRFFEESLPRFFAGTYAGAYMDAQLARFEALLPETPPWKLGSASE